MTELDLDQRVSVLKRCAIFERAPLDALVVLATMMRIEHFHAGETVCEHGEPAHAVYVVAEGDVEVFLPGRSEPLRRMGPGEILGEYGMLTNASRTSTVIAHSDAVLLSVDYERFRTFLVGFPEATLALLEVTARRLLESEKKR